MKRIYGIITVSLLLFSLSSCDKDVLRGSGATVTRTKTLDAFSAVEIVGNRNAEIIHSTESKVEITGYENLVDILDAKLEDDKLYFEYPHHQVVKNDNIRFKIYTPVLNHVQVIGNGEAKVGNGFNSPEFKTEMSGNGVVHFGDNNFQKLTINTSGNARVYARPATASQAFINLSGNGNVEVNAVDKVRIHVSGSGDVHYWGNPAEVDVEISGNGHAVKH